MTSLSGSFTHQFQWAKWLSGIVCSSPDIPHVYRSDRPTWSPWPSQNNIKHEVYSLLMCGSTPVIMRADEHKMAVFINALRMERVSVVYDFTQQHYVFRRLRVFIRTQFMFPESGVRLWLEVMLNIFNEQINICILPSLQCQLLNTSLEWENASEIVFNIQ